MHDRTLWLAVHARPGALALRSTATGDVLAVRSDVGDDNPAYRSIRVDLGDLPAPGTVSYDVVLVPPGGGAATAVWAHPLPQADGVRPPVSDDGTHVWRLARLDDGGLQVRRTPLPPTVALRDIRVENDTVLIAVSTPATGEQVLRLVDAEGAQVLSRPLTARDGLLHATLSRGDLPPGGSVLPQVRVGDLPVRRWRDDLDNPDAATALPLLMGEDDKPALRFRYLPDGTLAVRLAARPRPEEA